MYIIKKTNGGFVNDTEIHPHDLLSAKIKDAYKK